MIVTLYETDAFDLFGRKLLDLRPVELAAVGWEDHNEFTGDRDVETEAPTPEVSGTDVADLADGHAPRDVEAERRDPLGRRKGTLPEPDEPDVKRVFVCVVGDRLDLTAVDVVFDPVLDLHLSAHEGLEQIVRW